MSNSDYLIKATIKKISEKLNNTLSSKIDEAATAAKEVPELLIKEIEILKDEIIDEAKKMQKEVKGEDFYKENTTVDPIYTKTRNKINFINQKINDINTILDN